MCTKFHCDQLSVSQEHSKFWLNSIEILLVGRAPDLVVNIIIKESRISQDFNDEHITAVCNGSLLTLSPSDAINMSPVSASTQLEWQLTYVLEIWNKD